LKIEILFDEDGNWDGHIWEQNCSYSKEDLERNDNYRLDEWDIERLQEVFREWEEEERGE
jgi:hypothetical protein